MICELCEEEEAVVTMIPIGEGMPQSVGRGCFARIGLGAAKEVLPAEEIADTLGPMFVRPSQKPTVKPQEGTGGRKRQKATQKPAAPEGPSGGPAEEPTTGTDG